MSPLLGGLRGDATHRMLSLGEPDRELRREAMRGGLARHGFVERSARKAARGSLRTGVLVVNCTSTATSAAFERRNRHVVPRGVAMSTQVP
jgi:hypothetical protein